MRQTDFDTLTGSSWSANPADYNRLNYLTFGKDGFGRLVLGAFQTVYTEVAYRFEVPEPGLLCLTYVEWIANEFYWERGELGRQLVEAESGVPRNVKYSFRLGEFSGEMNMGSDRGPFKYDFSVAADP
jgi:hypothetical protein